MLIVTGFISSSQHFTLGTIFTTSTLLHFKIASKTTCSLSAAPSDIRQCSVAHLAHLPAKVMCLHLSSRHLVTSGSKAVMPKLLHKVINQSSLPTQTAIIDISIITPIATVTSTSGASTLIIQSANSP